MTISLPYGRREVGQARDGLPGAVVAEALGGVEPAGWPEPGQPVDHEDLPAAVVDQRVVIASRAARSSRVGFAAVDPVLDVVGVAFAGASAAAGVGAVAVAEVERAADVRGHDAGFAAEVEDFGCGAEDGGDEVGVAGEAAGGFGADVGVLAEQRELEGAVGCWGGLAELGAQGLVVDGEGERDAFPALGLAAAPRGCGGERLRRSVGRVRRCPGRPRGRCRGRTGPTRWSPRRPGPRLTRRRPPRPARDRRGESRVGGSLGSSGLVSSAEVPAVAGPGVVGQVVSRPRWWASPARSSRAWARRSGRVRSAWRRVIRRVRRRCRSVRARRRRRGRRLRGVGWRRRGRWRGTRRRRGRGR